MQGLKQLAIRLLLPQPGATLQLLLVDNKPQQPLQEPGLSQEQRDSWPYPFIRTRSLTSHKWGDVNKPVL